MKKLLSLLNVKKWFQTFVFKTLVNKGVKHAVTVIIGLLAGAEAQEIMTNYGVTLDPAQLQVQLSALFGGLAGWFINWAQKVMDPDQDGEIG